ncbi:MAG: hypothetical protein LH624_17660 [Cryobacterium sp.]|nr:hypothetical protein [Cryobacterium sp.]
MEKPIYEIPAIQPGANVSWWDAIAAEEDQAVADAAVETDGEGDTAGNRLNVDTAVFATGALNRADLATELLETVPTGSAPANQQVYQPGSLQIPAGRRAAIQTEPV